MFSIEYWKDYYKNYKLDTLKKNLKMYEDINKENELKIQAIKEIMENETKTNNSGQR